MKPPTRTALAQATLQLIWVGLLAVGASGLLAAAITAVFGADFVDGDLPGVTYTADRCAVFQATAPAGSTCAHAAAVHHADETAGYRVDAGVLGLIALVGWVAWRRGSRPATGALPPGLVAGAGAATFGVVGLGLTLLGLDMLLLGAGAGAFLSAGIVSLAVAAVFAAQLYSSLSRL